MLTKYSTTNNEVVVNKYVEYRKWVMFWGLALDGQREVQKVIDKYNSQGWNVIQFEWGASGKFTIIRWAFILIIQVFTLGLLSYWTGFSIVFEKTISDSQNVTPLSTRSLQENHVVQSTIHEKLKSTDSLRDVKQENAVQQEAPISKLTSSYHSSFASAPKKSKKNYYLTAIVVACISYIGYQSLGPKKTQEVKTATEYFDESKNLFKTGSYELAIEELNELIKAYPGTKDAKRAVFLISEIKKRSKDK